MMPFRALALLAAVSFAAACSTDEEPTRRRTTAGDPGSPGDPTDPTNPGGGGTGSTGILLIEVSAASVTGAVGQLVTVTAQGWLDSAKTEPVTSGTMIDFTVSPTSLGALSVSQAQANAQGRASVTVGATAPGAVTVTASLSGLSDSASVVFLAPGQTGGTGGTGGGTTVRTVGGVSVHLNKTSVVVNNDSALDTNDEASVLVTVVDDKGVVFSGQTVTISASDGSLSAVTGTTNSSGQLVVKYTAGIVAQDVTITATVADKDGTGLITVGPGAPLVINVADPAPAQIGVRGSGNESSVVEFTITDKFGNPVSDNTTVTFSIVPALAGVSVSPLSTTTHDGKVSPVVNAGTKSGAVRLVATVPSVGRSITSGKITIFGGVPSQSRFAMASDVLVLSGYYKNAQVANVTVTATDRYGNPVVPGTSIYVTCEAGRCGANDQVGISTDDLGHASFEVESAFQDLLWNSGVTTVVNFGGSVGTAHTWSSLGSPKDGWVNVIAVAVGESGFDDSNSNGFYDTGDRLTYEFSEPFVDVNSNGIYDDGTSTSFIEDFWDYDADGVFDPATGAYQARSYIWDQHTLIWSGWPAPYPAPQQYVDVDGDGVYDPDLDLFAVGGPSPINQADLLARFPWLPVTATLSSGYAGYISTSTSMSVNFSDTNNNPLPKGSAMSAGVLSDLIEVKSPPASFLTYGGDYSQPLSARFFNVKDKDVATMQSSTDVFCATVKVGDTGDEIGYCIPGVIF